MNFEDLHDHKDDGYYIVPNEDTLTWRKLVKGLRVNRAAAICSSGEVGLVALLPTVRQELVLVDHSYASLAVAMLKYVMLRELGASETRRLLTSKDGKNIRENVDRFVDTLPEKVQEAYHKFVKVRGYDGDFARCYNRQYDYNNIDPATGYYKVIEDGPLETNSSLVREWRKLPPRDVLKCTTKLHKVKFVHGDLSDLAKLGKFDLLYLSNALDHQTRKGAHPVIKEVAACLAPGAHVIVAHRSRGSYDYYGTERKIKEAGWEKVKSSESTAGMTWQHSLFRVPTEQAAAA